MSLQKLSNGDLWRKYKAATEDWAQDPENAVKKRVLSGVEDECVRRMQEASRRPLRVASQ